MTKPRATLAAVEEFLGHKRLAMVGVSRNKDDFTRIVFREFSDRGYEVVPVNPAATEIEGQRCYPGVREISPPVEGAILMTPPDVTETVVRDCAAAGIPRVWMHGGGGRGAVSENAVSFCLNEGIGVVAGQCPLMFIQESGGVHKVHALFKRLFGTYPK